METITIARIRPVSWKIVVQGRQEAEAARQILEGLRIDTTECAKEPGLMETPLYAFVATPAAEAPLSSEELQAALGQDERVSFEFRDD